jgi:hypothetical protein
MRRLFPLLTILVLPFVSQAQDVYYRGDLAPLNILPTFDKGYLAVYEREHTIALYGPDGFLAYRATAQVPGAKWANVINASPDSDGSLALAVEYQNEKLRAGGVAVFDHTGMQAAFIDTGADWSPTQVCFGADHSIWAMGWRGLDSSKASTPDYFVLRNYARDGRLIGAYLSRSSFEQEPVGPIVGGWQLRSANGRIGGLFYATSVLPLGSERRMREWIETDLRGNIVRRVDLSRKTILAFSSDGSLYARENQGGYMALNPALNSWRTIPASANEVLLGADDGSLVFLIRGTNQVVWSPVETGSSSTFEGRQ